MWMWVRKRPVVLLPCLARQPAMIQVVLYRVVQLAIGAALHI